MVVTKDSFAVFEEESKSLGYIWDPVLNGKSLGPAWVYHKISNISRTKSQNLNDSHLVLQSSLPNPLRPGVKSRMKM